MNPYAIQMGAVLAVLFALSPIAHAAPPENVTVCHKPGTPAERTLTIPRPAVRAHLVQGGRLGACGERPPCSQPVLPPEVSVGIEPNEAELELTSDVAVAVEGAAPTSFNPSGTPITFKLSCPTLKTRSDAVIVYDNNKPVPFAALQLTSGSITIPGGLTAGRHKLDLLAQDIYGFTIEHSVTLWVGNSKISVLVLDEANAPVPGATVVVQLADDAQLRATLTTDATGSGTFANLPDRSFNVIATAPGNGLATRPATVNDGLITLRVKGFKPTSAINNNDFSQGLAGWEIGNAPVSLVPHIEGQLGVAALKVTSTIAGANTASARTKENSQKAANQTLSTLTQASLTAAAMSDFDLSLGTSGEGQQSVSRTFTVEPGYKSVTVRYRFITSEVPGGYFGSKFKDFYNVSIRTLKGGGTVTAGNSMNSLGLSAFNGAGATSWGETELLVDKAGDTVQVDIAVANVADGLFPSQVVVDGIKKKRLSLSALQLNDVDNGNLQFLSASNHTYFGGNTRVHGTLTVEGPKEDSLDDLRVEVLEGAGVVATGTLASGATSALYKTFGDTEQIKLTSSQLLFEIPGNQLGGANQTANGSLTLRVRARSSSGEVADRDFGSVTKLVRFMGANRYGGRDAEVGGDDWAKPTVAIFAAGTAHTWGDFSNMNGGPFPPHGTHRTGNSADGWFPGYNDRNAATAATIIGHLNTHGTRIRTVYVTFAEGSPFANAIANVNLQDGRQATDVIRNVGGHTTHFHWEIAE